MASFLKFIGGTFSYIAVVGSFLITIIKKFWKIFLFLMLVFIFIVSVGKINKMGKKQRY